MHARTPRSPDERRAVLEKLETMSSAELNALPVGIVTLALDGTVLAYNEAEAAMSRRNAEQQLGKNFFRDVAPCTAETEFEESFQELAREGASGTREFSYVFRFVWGIEEVLITFMRSAGSSRIYVLITWLSHEH